MKEVFSSDRALSNTSEIKNAQQNSDLKLIGTISDAFKRTSRNGNDYLKISIEDEKGSMDCLFMNSRQRVRGSWRNNNRLDKYLEENDALPEKGNIVMMRCTKGEDVLFVEDLSVLDKKIYLKLSDLK